MKIIAHGGYSAKYPEGTVESFKAAVPYNPYAIEMDVLYDSKANVFRCFRPSGESDAKGTFNLEDQVLASFPTFEEVLSQINWSGKVLFDLKNPSVQALDKLRSLPQKLQGDLIVGIRDVSLFKYLFDKKFLDTNQQPIYFETLGLVSSLNEVKEFVDFGCSYIRLWEKDISAISRFEGLKIWITPGTKKPRTAGQTTIDTLKMFHELGVDGVLLNDLELAKSLI